MKDFSEKYREAYQLLKTDKHSGIDSFIEILKNVDPYDHETYDGIGLVFYEELTPDDIPYLKEIESNNPNLENYLAREIKSLEDKFAGRNPS